MNILWIVIVASFGAFYYGWATGSNDVANAFGTSVGAKTLTLKQAVLLAAIFEFVGALVLGRVSTSVVAGKIANIDAFKANPEVYAYGMMCSLWVGSIWQHFASYKGWNVSSTHSIIGGIIGFSMAYGGPDAVQWIFDDPTSVTKVAGVTPIILSWFISPVMTATAAAIIFWLSRYLILRRENAQQLSYFAMPCMVLLTVWVNVYFVFTKGSKKLLADGANWSDQKAKNIAAIVAVVCAAVSCLLVPLIKTRIAHLEAQEQRKANRSSVAPVLTPTISGASSSSSEEVSVAVEMSKVVPDIEANKEANKEQEGDVDIIRKKQRRSTMQMLTHGVNVDIHKDIDKDPVVAAMHKRAEQFDPRAERVFSYLQVFSAMCVIFAHGAGEVGYMAGPLGAIWTIHETGELPSKVMPPVWVILIGAFGLVVGLSTYGYQVTRAMGTQMAYLSPSRGFAAELATSLVIMVAAQYGLPTSSSQCITGGILGVGLIEGVTEGVNWRFFATTFFSWVFTLVFMGVGTALVFAQGVYAPCA